MSTKDDGGIVLLIFFVSFYLYFFSTSVNHCLLTFITFIIFSVHDSLVEESNPIFLDQFYEDVFFFFKPLNKLFDQIK